MTPDGTRRCLTPDEYARERRVSTRTVYRLIKAGRLRAERVGSQWRIWLTHRTPQDNTGQTLAKG